ncbi:MAG TPA: ATP-binding protein [Chitinophagaceae bacterium]|jgi:two-component system CheB/CheR fusion protein|nr:ATP-binding protein [Chitinophagaceae bacterium]
MMETTENQRELIAEIEELRQQLQEANETINAIRTGQIDALVVSTEGGPQLYTLKSADHTYRAFIEKMKEGAVTLNKEEIILYSNSQFASMVNLPLSKVIGLPFSQFIPDRCKEDFNALIQSGWQSDSKGEILLKNSSREIIPVLLSFTSLQMDEGTTLSVILTDLSVQKETQNQLKTKNGQLEEARRNVAKMNEELENMVKERTKDLLMSREYFKYLANNIPVIIWTADTAGKLDYVNRRWSEYTGYDLEESKTKQSELVHPDDLETSSAAWRQSLKYKQKYEQEYRFKRNSDSAYRWHYAQAIPFKDEHGNVTAWIGTSIDIDDQKKQLERKDEFIGVVSHELKTPLTSLKGYLQLMGIQDSLPDLVKSYISKANISLAKLQRLVDELLDVSRIKAGKLEFSKQIFNLTELVTQCVENSSIMYPLFTIKKELQENIMVMGNEERIEQVFMNLINNAVKYAPDSKKIIVRTESNGDSATVSVTDFGAGMSDEDQKFIFERFYRANGQDHLTPGLGMGLYIASEIIKEHRGEIKVKSKLNEGCVFSFSLPLVTQQ